ncbi:MAG: ABC transporter permease [Bacteroidota bacterium]
MILNYLKLAWRNLGRNKASSVINIGGLAIGMAVSFMLLLYVYNEFSFDKFNTNGNRLYQVFKNQPGNGDIKTKPLTPQPLAAALKKDFPEIQNVTRTSEPADILLSYGDKGLKVNTLTADPALLDMFSFHFIYGNKSEALAGQSTIVLTQSVAKALFGNSNPLGAMVKFANQFPLKVSAVIADNPQNSSFSFKALISWQTFLAQQPWMKDVGWDNYSYFTYVLLKPGASANGFNAKLKQVIAQYYPKDKAIQLFAYPFTRLHLYGEFKNGVNSGGSIEYVRLFLFLAIGILLIACINFMNLSTARSERRAREVGIRKAIGARRIALIGQFMGESLLMAFLSFLLALLLMVLFFPVFANTVNIQLSLPYGNIWAWVIALAVTLFTGLLAGSYPALYLSSFKPVNVLKGQFISTKTTVRPRQVLVILQFTFAICLILSSLFIYKQINYIKNRPVGYSRNGLVEMPVDGNLFNQFKAFRQDAINAGAITDAALISDPITSVTSSTWGMAWPGQLPGEDKLSIDCMAATYHFIGTYGLQLSQGRDFATDRPADSTAIILNEAAVQMMRLKTPIGQRVKWLNVNRTVIGVVKNFVSGSPYEPVKPVVIAFVKGWASNIGLRLNPNAPVSQSLAILQAVYKKYNPAYPFQYHFTDENFSRKFKNEQLLGTMSVGFTGLAIIISCLGLFGLASFSAGQRRKEIGIRKILGAGTTSLWFKLSQDFVKLVLLSFIIGSAISWYSIQQWLNKYTYHTTLSIWAFAATLVLSVAICLIAVSWQAIKAALVNPAKSLRSE